MHRVDSDGYIIVSGKRRYIDQNLPGTPGTVDSSYWSNAIQEEIAGLIEYAGLTLAASGAADEAAGWQQLRQAIFSSGKIDSAALAQPCIYDIHIHNNAVKNIAINDVSVAKLTAGIASNEKIDINATIGADNFTWTQGLERLLYNRNSSGILNYSDLRAHFFKLQQDSDYLQLEYDKILIQDNGGASVSIDVIEAVFVDSTGEDHARYGTHRARIWNDDGAEYEEVDIESNVLSVNDQPTGGGTVKVGTSIRSQGISYTGTLDPGETFAKLYKYRKAGFHRPNDNAAWDNGNWRISTPLGGSIDMGLPISTKIIAAWCQYETVAGKQECAPVAFTMDKTTGPNLLIDQYVILVGRGAESDPPSNGPGWNIIYEYDGDDLS